MVAADPDDLELDLLGHVGITALRAITYLKRALEIDAKNSMAHALLGRAYRALGRKDDEVVELKTAASLQEANPRAGGDAK